MAPDPVTATAPALNRARQHEIYQRALRTLPGGTNSNFRAWGEDTIYVDRGEGGWSGMRTATSSSTCGWATAR